MDKAALRESIAIEDNADCMAMLGDFHEASWLMKQVNAIRARELGLRGCDPNILRERTREALGL